jgi:hypothetical protein
MGSYALVVPYSDFNAARRNWTTNEFAFPFREYNYARPATNPGNNMGLMRGIWSSGPDGQWGIATVDDDGNGTVDDYSEAGYLGSDDFVSDALLDHDPISGQLPHNNTDRNPYFRYDAIQRLGNLLTNRSNVFAVWITVGYFEVDPSTGEMLDPNPAICELGSDTGDIRRHRGFFIIDRSIPVAYEQGIDHNVEQTIMVQSYIE